MRLRVIATDYDGTIASDGVLDGCVRKAIVKARQRGVLFEIVTGRTHQLLREQLCLSMAIRDTNRQGFVPVVTTVLQEPPGRIDNLSRDPAVPAELRL